VSSNYIMTKSHSRKLTHFSDFNTLLKISLGLMVITILSSTLAYAETVSVDVEGNLFDVDYTATGMTISGVEADLDSISLIFNVDVTDSSGTLDVVLDRSFFDSTFQGADDDFLVLADGDFANFIETETNSQSRTLSIELPAGTDELEIIGYVFGDSAPKPVVETPEPVVETPEPVVETPEPVVETPEPVVETPEPVVETPKTQCGPGTILKDGECVLDSTPEPVVETPKTQCGPGTILKDGVCVLDERCGPGTILKDGECVLDSTPKPTETSVKGMGAELVIAVVVSFVIAGIIGIIVAIMSKVSKSND